MCESHKNLIEEEQKAQEFEFHSHHEEKISATRTNKQYTTCITWLVLLSKQHYQ
jgi:hypothetical protein